MFSNKIKIASIVLLVLLAFNFAAPSAHAIFGIGDVVFDPTVYAGIIAQTAQFIQEQVVKVALATLKKRLLDMIVDEIILYIQGYGKPTFITDWKAFFGDYVNIVGGDLAIRLGLSRLCSPFAFQVQLAVFQPPLFSDRVSCTLDQIVRNVQNFYDDFRNGGFIAYRELWNPANNFYGALIMAMDEKELRLADELYAASRNAIAGQGFLGTRKCDPSGRFCYITTPGTTVGALAAKAVGADLDFLISAEDLSAYVAAISDALINRLIREGAEGLIGVSTPKAPPRGYIEKSGKDCEGLSGEALESCLAYQGTGTRNIKEAQKAYLEQISATLLPLTAAENNLRQSIILQEALVSQLRELKTCQQNRGFSELSQTTTELTQEETALNQLNTDLIAINEATTPLLNAKIQIENPPSEDPFDIYSIFRDISDLLDSAGANQFQTDTAARQVQIKNKVDARLPQVRNSLTQCRGF